MAKTIRVVLTNWKFSRYLLPSGRTVDVHVLNCSEFRYTLKLDSKGENQWRNSKL